MKSDSRVNALCLALTLFSACALHLDAATWYVATNGNDSAAGTNWATAKMTIQAAIDLTVSNDTVLVSNGVYATGGRVASGALTNRVAITNAITVASVNGPAVTIIQGHGPSGNDAIRCVYLGTNATLSGVTLTNGSTRSGPVVANEMNGGGALCEPSAVISNCILTGNSANNAGGGACGGTLNYCTVAGNLGGSYGGGSFSGTLNNCTLQGNSCGSSGGGAYGGTLNNCTVSGNSASFTGGGAFGGTQNNCIIFFNNAAGPGPNYSSASLNYCCTTPSPGGVGNITNGPLFVNAGASDFHLQAASPCIDGGSNAYAHGSIDLDGNPRIIHGTVDMGAYEYQYNGGYWAWAGAITNNQTNFNQSATGDGYPNLLKYATGSSPTNSDTLADMNSVPTNQPFSMQFYRNTNAADVTLVVEGAYIATNDATWNGIATNINGSWGGATNVAESGTTNPVVVTVQDTVSPGAATNRFLRLRVTRP